MSITKITTGNTATDAAKAKAQYDRQEEILKNEIDSLNVELGFAKMADSWKDGAVKGITYGYIGNGTLSPNGWNLSNVRWYIFLPHPGRVGNADDSIGGWKTDSLEGILAARRAFKSFAQGVRFARTTR